MIKVKFKKVHPDAVIPKYQTDGASGFDLHAVEDVEFYEGETKIVKTGLTMEIVHNTQDGDEIDHLFELQVRPRSGVSAKTNLRIANSPGTVDYDYRGEIGIIMTNNRWFDPAAPAIRLIKKGDRIAQGVIVPVARAKIEEVTELSQTERGSGGYGSTGK